MSDTVRVMYTVTVVVDSGMWMNNYGLPAETVKGDVASSMVQFIEQSVNDYIVNTGNMGYAVARQQ
jgi:hypothetical protein